MHCACGHRDLPRHPFQLTQHPTPPPADRGALEGEGTQKRSGRRLECRQNGSEQLLPAINAVGGGGGKEPWHTHGQSRGKGWAGKGPMIRRGRACTGPTAKRCLRGCMPCGSNNQWKSHRMQQRWAPDHRAVPIGGALPFGQFARGAACGGRRQSFINVPSTAHTLWDAPGRWLSGGNSGLSGSQLTAGRQARRDVTGGQEVGWRARSRLAGKKSVGGQEVGWVMMVCFFQVPATQNNPAAGGCCRSALDPSTHSANGRVLRWRGGGENGVFCFCGRPGGGRGGWLSRE